MNAFDATEFPPGHVLLRSHLRRDRRPFVPDAYRQGRRRDERSMERLVGHLAVTSLGFLALVTLVWVVSWFFHFLHFVRPFPKDIFLLLDKLEILLAYADVTASGIVLLNGIWKFLSTAIRGDS